MILGIILICNLGIVVGQIVENEVFIPDSALVYGYENYRPSAGATALALKGSNQPDEPPKIYNFDNSDFTGYDLQQPGGPQGKVPNPFQQQPGGPQAPGEPQQPNPGPYYQSPPEPYNQQPNPYERQEPQIPLPPSAPDSEGLYYIPYDQYEFKQGWYYMHNGRLMPLPQNPYQQLPPQGNLPGGGSCPEGVCPNKPFPDQNPYQGFPIQPSNPYAPYTSPSPDLLEPDSSPRYNLPEPDDDSWKFAVPDPTPDPTPEPDKSSPLPAPKLTPKGLPSQPSLPTQPSPYQFNFPKPKGDCPGGVCPMPGLPGFQGFDNQGGFGNPAPFGGGCPNGNCPRQSQFELTPSYFSDINYPTSGDKQCNGGVCAFTQEESASLISGERLSSLEIFVPQGKQIQYLPSLLTGGLLGVKYFGDGLIAPDASEFSGSMNYEMRGNQLTSYVKKDEFLYSNGIWISNVEEQRGVKPEIEEDKINNQGNLYVSSLGAEPIVPGNKGGYATIGDEFFVIGSVGESVHSASFGPWSILRTEFDEHVSVYANEDSSISVAENTIIGMGESYSAVLGDKIITKKDDDIYLVRDPVRSDDYNSPNLVMAFLDEGGESVLKDDEVMVWNEKEFIIANLNEDKENPRPRVVYNMGEKNER